MDPNSTAQQLPFDRLEPTDEEDRIRRALFYCHCLHLYSKRTLDLMITRCISGEFGDELEDQAPQISDWQLESAYKLLTCISLHMVGLDNCNEDAPGWFLSFFSDAARETDELFPIPAAIEIIERHGSWKRERMVRDVTVEIMEILNFNDEAGELGKELAHFLVESSNYRVELLLFALSQPLEALRRHLEVASG